jgi:CDP-diacylglycerol pyrophosphatase
LAALATIRRSLANAAVATCCLVTLGVAPLSAADPGGTPAPTFQGCGNPDDHDVLWDGNAGKSGQGVKAASPSDFTGNVDVVFPTGEPSRGYALKNGQQGGAKYDFLLVPTVRETGIECANLLNKAPEYFTYAYNYVASAPKGLPPGTDWALGIESGDPKARTFNQLHIHVSRLRPETRDSLNQVSGKCAANEGDWLKSIVVLKVLDYQGNIVPRTFRCWNASAMTHGFFSNLNDNVVSKLKGVNMSNETMLITTNKNKPGGYLVLASDRVSPDLNKNGVNNIEGLLNKG